MNLVDQLREFGPDEPERELPVAHQVSSRVGVLPVEVGAELGEQGGHGRGKPAAVVLQRHRGGRLPVDDRPRPVQTVATFDSAVHPMLAHDFEHPRLGQQGDMAVDSGLGNIGQSGAQLGGGAHAPARHRVDDAQPHRVQEQVERVQHRYDPISGTIFKVEKSRVLGSTPGGQHASGKHA